MRGKLTTLAAQLGHHQDDSTEALSESVDPHTEFQAQLPYMGLSKSSLTLQQEKLVTLVASGMSVAAAGRGAGYSSYKAAHRAAKIPQVAQAINYFREQMREEVRFSKENAHLMYMEAYAASATATEMKSTVDSMCKLHGLHIPDNATQVNININGTKQLERMSDEDLLKIAGKNEDYLEPSTTG